MTQIQKRKRIEYMLERNKTFFKHVYELSKSYEDSEGFSLSKEQWAEVKKRDKGNQNISEKEYSEFVRKTRLRLKK